MGLGPIGQRLTRYITEREGIAVIGGIEPDLQKVGKDIGVWAGLENKGVEIAESIGSCSNLDEVDVAVISTVSSLKDIEAQIKEAADYRLDIVSTCEELSYPWQTHPDLDNDKVFNFLKNREETLYFSDSNFDDNLLGPGWSWSDHQYYYQTEKTPLPIYGNIVLFTIQEIEQRKIAETDGGLAVYPPYFQNFIEKGEKESYFSSRNDR